MVSAIELIGAIGIILMLAFRFGAPKWCATCGQGLVLVSFTLIAYALLRAHSYWVGAGFAVAVLFTVVATTRGILRKHRQATSV